MKSFLYAASALIIATSAAQAASTASDRAGGATAPTAQGERLPLAEGQRITPVMLQREFGGYSNPPSPTNTGAVFRSWTGNDNEG